MRPRFATAAIVLAATACAGAVGGQLIGGPDESDAAKRKPSAAERKLQRNVVALEKVNRSALAAARSVQGLLAKPSPAGPPGPQGPGGEPGLPGEPGAGGNSGAAGAAAYAAPIPSGRTLTGAWGASVSNPGVPMELTISLPVRAPSPLTDADALFGAGSAGATDVDAARCPGSFADPQAAPGSACLYAEPSAQLNVGSLQAHSFTPAPDLGFTVVITTTNTGTPATRLRVRGTWAYTAP